MDFFWKIAIDAGIISAALLLASALRHKLKFLQKFMVPNALTAGFILLPVYNFILPLIGLGQHRLGDLVYHLLNISFIAMSLRAPTPKAEHRERGSVWGMSTVILSQYAIQALIGLGLALLFVVTIAPQLSLAIGLTLPLGFALGPGQAYAIGKGWESMGFPGAGSVGLTMAALGYLWSCIVGVALVNIGTRKGWLTHRVQADAVMLTGLVPKDKEKPVAMRSTTDLEALDPLSFHTAIVALTYLLSYLLLLGLTYLLSFAGKAGTELANNLWGINFIFSAVTALLVRFVLDKLKLGHYFDDDALSRISGFSIDFMVAAAIAAISLVFVAQYWLPILVISTIGGIVTVYTVPWWSARIFRDHRFERMIMLFGVSTGTLSTGLALLRIVDPEFKTKVSRDYMLASGLTFLLAIPFILSINLPAKATETGSMVPFWTMIGISAGYLIYCIISYMLVAKEKSFKNPGKLWID